LIIKELSETPIEEVDNTLHAIPDDLNQLYNHLLSKLNSKQAKVAKSILRWVVMAPRPMKLTELAIACSVKSSYTSASAIDSMLIIGFGRNVTLCGPILKIDNGYVHLVHQSAKVSPELEILLSPDARSPIYER
jgi:hypothetical protein